MKVIVAKIPRDGLDLEFSKSMQWLADNLDRKDELVEYICGGLDCKCRVEILKNDIFIKGKAEIKLKPICHRCGSQFERSYSASLDLTCVPNINKKCHRGKDYMDGDVGLNYYSGGELDIAKIAREQILLSLPMTFLCKPDCGGVCTVCGKRINGEACGCMHKNKQ